jgi:hypothetical protein
MPEAARAAIISAGKDKNLSGDSLSSAVLSGDLERVSRMLIAGVNVDSLDSVSWWLPSFPFCPTTPAQRGTRDFVGAAPPGSVGG